MNTTMKISRRASAISITALSLLLLPASLLAQTLSPAQENGKEVYDKWCTPCHGRVAGGVLGGMMGAHALPGTSALAIKYSGDLPPVLEDRTDLQPIYIRTVVRNGLFGMPITRKTEVSDAELEDIISYLTGAR